MAKEKATDDTKKQKYAAIIIATVLVLVACLFLFLVAPDMFKGQYREALTSDKDYLYDRSLAFLKANFYDSDTRKAEDGYTVLIDAHRFGITEHGKWNYVYMWVLSESYYLRDGQLYLGRSNSSLYRFKYSNDKYSTYENPALEEERSDEFIMSNVSESMVEDIRRLSGNKYVTEDILAYQSDLSNEEHLREAFPNLEDYTIHREAKTE